METRDGMEELHGGFDEHGEGLISSGANRQKFIEKQEKVAGKSKKTRRMEKEPKFSSNVSSKNTDSTEHYLAFVSDSERNKLLNSDGNGANFIEMKTTTTNEKQAVNKVCSSCLTENKGDTGMEELLVGFDEHGEGLISRKLYKEISKEILPLEHLLFYFFRRVSFVIVYAFMMFTVMTLSRDAGVSENLQVIGAIVGVLIPFIFDTIYADHHLSQKACQNMATKEKLLHILKFRRLENNTVFVELININNDEGEYREEENNFKQECSQAWNGFKKHFSLSSREDNNHV